LETTLPVLLSTLSKFKSHTNRLVIVTFREIFGATLGKIKVGQPLGFVMGSPKSSIKRLLISSSNFLSCFFVRQLISAPYPIAPQSVFAQKLVEELSSFYLSGLGQNLVEQILLCGIVFVL